MNDKHLSSSVNVKYASLRSMCVVLKVVGALVIVGSVMSVFPVGLVLFPAWLGDKVVLFAGIIGVCLVFVTIGGVMILTAEKIELDIDSADHLRKISAELTSLGKR